MAITRVALAGGTGNLGPAILRELLNADFRVTVLSRSASSQVDARARVQVVDFNSRDSLVNALRGHDAFVNVLGVGVISLDIHLRILEAAHAAGIHRFIPSEFGCDTANPNTALLPAFSDKITLVKRLEELSKKDKNFTYTAIITGPFLDWGIKHGLLVNLQGPTTIYDGGDVPVSTNTLAGVGRAVVGTLKHAEKTKNRYVYAEEARVTQNQLLNWSGKSDQFEPVFAKTEDLEREGFEAFHQSSVDWKNYTPQLIRRAVFGGKFGTAFTKVDNEVLGLSKLSESDLIRLVKE
ncbi:oxidoreductase CipA-like protein [Beauveria brongniartii RCEF 3172]|uniref:Oxidoreductase CipA-like protein n=1 Tax=Beauveria brongniartii RCEF 3172 TaxID=1081107 RepID=A0A166XXZ6_9HYPO|nr:oxidoreductase CipA-like protein [Beauveria brongniartii RCEF 3172]